MKAIYHISLLFIALCMLAMTSCDKKQTYVPKKTLADSLILAATNTQNLDRAIFLSDSLLETGDISIFRNCYIKGGVYLRTGRPRDAETTLKRALAEKPQNTYDSLFYFQCLKSMVEYTTQKGDNEGLLRVALPAYEGLYALVSRPEYASEAYDILAEILQYVGVSHINLGMASEGEKYLDKCYDCIRKVRALDNSWKHDYYATIFLYNIAISYSFRNNYHAAEKWLNYAEAITKDMASKENVPDFITDMSWSTCYINRATICNGLGKQKEADQAYAEYKRTQYSKTTIARIHEGEYLLRAKRYAQSADAYAIVYQYLKDFGTEPTLNNMEYLTKKFNANYKAGRKDSALSVAAYTFEYLDSAIILEKKNQALELATIYQTQQKDAEIAEQKAKLMYTRVIALGVVIILLVVFFTIYALIRRSERKRLEEKNQQLTIANERAEESSRMKTRFIQQISHEFRTPLNILSGFAQVVTAGDMELDEAARREANQQILENTDRITGLVNKMLELSDASSRTVIQLTDNVLAVQIALSAVEVSGIEKASHLTFELLFDEGCDAVKLITCQSAAVRALSLLIDNARKFTAPAEAFGHQVSTDEKQRVVLKLHVVDGNVQFVVEDTGIGIPAAEAERIFDEFVQLNEYYDGTGIGLTVARSLARRLGGDIQLDTTYTNGARFVFTLPMER